MLLIFLFADNIFSVVKEHKRSLSLSWMIAPFPFAVIMACNSGKVH